MFKKQSRPFQIGDRVKISANSKGKGAGTIGLVTKITSRYTSLNNGHYASHKYIIPFPSREAERGSVENSTTSTIEQTELIRLGNEIKSCRNDIYNLRNDIGSVRNDLAEIASTLNALAIQFQRYSKNY